MLLLHVDAGQQYRYTILMSFKESVNMKSTSFFIICCVLLLGCSKKEDYLIGYTGSLSRDIAEISLGGRDGAILAIEEVNDSGGISGRRMKLLIRDDQDRIDIAPAVDRELVESGVSVIVGHLNSTMTNAGLEYINKTDALLISPNSNSPIFLHKDDQLLCMLPSGEEMVKTMIRILEDEFNRPKVAVVYNGRNFTYTTPVSELFSKLYKEKGGEAILYPYNTTDKGFTYEEVVSNTLSENPKAIVLVTNAIDAVFFARIYHDKKAEVALVGADATCNEEILVGSGDATENFITVQAYSPTKEAGEYQRFRKSFQKRFGYIPSYDAMFSYSTVKMIAAALRKNPDERQLKSSLLKLGSFQGVATTITLNKYGDNEEPYSVLQVKNGSLVSYEK